MSREREEDFGGVLAYILHILCKLSPQDMEWEYPLAKMAGSNMKEILTQISPPNPLT